MAGIQTIRRRPRSDVLIFIDYDDTIFPTHYIGRLETEVDGILSLPDESERRRLLNDVKTAACRLLRTATSLGTVAIVTNSMDGWIADSAKRWSADLLPLLTRMPVISARTVFEGREAYALGRFANSLPRQPITVTTKTGGTVASTKRIKTTPRQHLLTAAAKQRKLDPPSTNNRNRRRRIGGSGPIPQAVQVNWKLLAFLLLVFRKQQIRSAAARQTAMQTGIHVPPSPLIVVSIGDSPVEREAVRRLSGLGLPNLAPVRSIKLCTDPTPADLAAQLLQISAALPAIVMRPTAVDVWLCPQIE